MKKDDFFSNNGKNSSGKDIFLDLYLSSNRIYDIVLMSKTNVFKTKTEGNIMKLKKVMALTMAGAMAATTLTACGSSSSTTETTKAAEMSKIFWKARRKKRYRMR